MCVNVQECGAVNFYSKHLVNTQYILLSYPVVQRGGWHSLCVQGVLDLRKDRVEMDSIQSYTAQPCSLVAGVLVW